MSAKQDFSRLPPLYEKVTTSTDTPEELQHRLHLEKARFYVSAFGVFLVFALLVVVAFFHQDTEWQKTAQIMLQTLASGFIGYLLRR